MRMGPWCTDLCGEGSTCLLGILAGSRGVVHCLRYQKIFGIFALAPTFLLFVVFGAMLREVRLLLFLEDLLV